jgi:CHAT domain-containing protein
MKARFLGLVQQLPRRSPEDLRAVGAAELLGDQVDNAIKFLRASVRGRNDANAWSDLAAAYLTAYEAQSKSLEIVDALAATDRALAINPKHAAAAFNHALALQRLGLLQEAIVAWKEALRLDATSPWAGEALAALRELQLEVPSRLARQDALKALEASRQPEALFERNFRQNARLARRTCETVYLGDWGEALLRGDEATAASRLALVRRIASILRRTSGEMLLADAASVVDDTKNNVGMQKALAEGSAKYSAARRAYGQQRVLEAEGEFRECERLFARAGSPLAHLARYSVASTLYAQQRTSEAEKMLDELANEKFADRGYHALAAQIGWERGLVKLVRGAFSEGRRILSDSRAEFEQLGESEAAATMDEFTAETDDFAGDAERAWTMRITAFLALSRADDATRKVTAIDAASAAFMVRGEWERAATVLNIASHAGTELHDPLRAAHAFIDRSIALAEMGDVARAEEDLREAGRWTSMLQDESQRRAIGERGLFTEALIARDPRESIALLNRDISLVLKTDRPIFAVQLLLERARRQRALGDTDAALADIGLAMAMLESQRASVTSVDGRALLARTAESVTAEAVMIAFARHTPTAAFDAIERWRGRAVLDALERVDDRNGAAARPMSLQEISRQLSPRSAIVEYALVSDHLIAFVIHHDRSVFVERLVDTSTLRAVVEAVSTATRKIDGRSDRSLSDAYAEFITPLAEVLSGIDVVAFVPEPHLPLPFSVLFDSISRQSVGDRFSTVVAPSATLAIRCSTAARDRTGNLIVAVAGDAFDPTAASGLRTLAHAAAESGSVARMYRNATLITGVAATKRVIAKFAPSANLIHFAGHATSTGSRAADSQLFVAPDHDSGTMTAAEVSRWDLRGTRLVFLSACRTGKAGPTGDGIENLATAFLIAGTPTVIAAAWDIDDRSAAEAAVRFHRSFSTGRSAAESLRLASINPDRPPWPPLTIFGGLPELVEKKGE